MNQVDVKAMRSRLGVSRSFAEDRQRARRKTLLALALLVIFVAGFGRVWLTTVVAEQVSEVHQLQDEIEQLTTDMTIHSAELDGRRAYAELHQVAGTSGLALEGPRAEVQLPTEPIVRRTLQAELAQDLRRGSELILTEALASTRSTEKVRASVR